MDIVSKRKRSWIMSRVPRKNTKPEQLVGDFLRSEKYRFRRNVKTLPGSPDIILPEYCIAIFIHGCFWHGHKNCRAAKIPSTNQDYWIPKIEANIKRDKRNKRDLREKNWKIMVIWQCQIKNKTKEANTFRRLRNKLKTK